MNLRKIFIVVLVVIVFLSTNTTMPVMAESGLENGDFEKGLTGWSAYKPDTELIQITADEKTKRRGRRALKLKTERIIDLEDFYAIAVQTIQVNSPCFLKFRGFAKTISVKNKKRSYGEAAVAMFHSRTMNSNSTDTPVLFQSISPQNTNDINEFPNLCLPVLSGTTDWTEINGSLYIPENVKSVNIQCMLFGTGSVWFDDFEVLEIKDTTIDNMAIMEEVWVENPTSGVKQCTHVFTPKSRLPGEKLPTVMILPGTRGRGSLFETFNLLKDIVNAGLVAVLFDADGRGLTEDGEDDRLGTVHQDGLHEVLKHITTLEQVDPDKIGMLAMSVDLILGGSTLGRYPMDPPIKFLLDWEGTDGRECGLKLYPDTDEFWTPRDAGRFMRRFPGNYCRLQTLDDHIQKDLDHAYRMVENTTNRSYGGKGNCNWTRINLGFGDFTNPSNTVFSKDDPPIWISDKVEEILYKKNGIIVRTLIELMAMPSPYGKGGLTIKLPIFEGRNRLGFLGPFHLPPNPSKRNELFKSFGVTDEFEYSDYLDTEYSKLKPSVARIAIPMRQGENALVDNLTELTRLQSRGCRIMVTLMFFNKRDPVETAKKVQELVEYFDGDGENDNRLGLVIKDWQIENEVNLKKYWKGTAKEYADHLKICYKAVKKADNTSNVVLAGEAVELDKFFYQELLGNLDGEKVFDAVDIHFYSDANDADGLTSAINRFKDNLENHEYSRDIPMWMTEFGVYSGNAIQRPASNEQLQASTFVKRTIIGAKHNLEGMCYVNLVDPNFTEQLDDYFGTMGLIHNGLSPSGRGAGHKRLIYWSYMKLSELLYGLDFESGKTVKFGSNLSAVNFKRPGDTDINFLWTIDGKKLESLEIPDGKYFVTPLVPEGDHGDKYETIRDAIKTFVINSENTEDIKRLTEIIGKTPVALKVIKDYDFADRIGVSGHSVDVQEDVVYSDELGVSWFRLADPFSLNIYSPGRKNDTRWEKLDSFVSAITSKKMLPIQTIRMPSFEKIDEVSYLSRVAEFVERYDGDGYKDAKGSPVILHYNIRSLPSNTKQGDEIKKYIEFIRKTRWAVKIAEPRAKIIVSSFKPGEGKNRLDFWSDFYETLSELEDEPGYPFMDAVDVSWSLGSADYSVSNYSALSGYLGKIEEWMSEYGMNME